MSWFMLKLMNMHVNITELSDDDVDYRYYLGPDYRGENFKGNVPKIICNHVSTFDTMSLLWTLSGNGSFVAGDFILHVPFIGSIAKKLGCIFLPRAGKKDQLDDTLKAMLYRTQLIEEEGEFPPLIIFPEGTCSNNTTMNKFRRGAFMDMRAVMPMTLMYRTGMVHPAVESIDEPIMLWYLCCSLSPIKIDVKQMPIFEPNDYLFEQHADKGDEKWEIYAWATRDLMCKVGKFGRSDMAWRDKIKVYNYYVGKINNFQMEDGTIVEYREDGKYINDSEKKLKKTQ